MNIPKQCEMREHQRFSSVLRSLSADIERYLNKSPENQAAGDDFKHRFGALLTPNLLALTLYRFSHWLYVNGWRRPGRILERINFLFHKVSLPMQSCIGPGCFLPHPAGVTFWGSAGSGLTLYSLAVCCPTTAIAAGPAELGPTLGDDVTIGAHAVVIGPVSIGSRTRLAFRLGVDYDLSEDCVVLPRELKVTTHPREVKEEETLCH